MCYSKPTVYAYVPNFVSIGLFCRPLVAKNPNFCHIFGAPSGKTMRQIPKSFWRCKNVLEVLYHRAKFGGARISPAARAATNVEFLSVCLSDTLWNVIDCAPDFAMNALDYINDFDTVG